MKRTKKIALTALVNETTMYIYKNIDSEEKLSKMDIVLPDIDLAEISMFLVEKLGYYSSIIPKNIMVKDVLNKIYSGEENYLKQLNSSIMQSVEIILDKRNSNLHTRDFIEFNLFNIASLLISHRISQIKSGQVPDFIV